MKTVFCKIRWCFVRLWLFAALSFFVAPSVYAEDSEMVHSKTVSIDLICADIYRGDILAAEKSLRQYEAGDPVIESLLQVLVEYKSYSLERQQKSSEVYSDHMEILAEMTLDREPYETENIELFFKIFIELMVLSDQEQKQILLNDPFVTGMLQATEEEAFKYDQKGDFSNALKYYGWLSAVGEENSEYSEIIEDINEWMKVESFMKADSCQTLDERYAGVSREMFSNAIKILRLRHLSQIDFNVMAEACLDRCLLVGEILYEPETEFDFEYRWDELNAFIDGIEEIREYMLDSSVTSSRMQSIFEIIHEVNIETINMPSEVLTAQISEACLSSIDVYTEIVWPSSVQRFRERITKQFSGIGIEVSMVPNSFKIVDLLLDTPAYNSKLMANDEVLSINGESTENMSIECAGEMITGREDTFVTLTVRHADSGIVEDVTVLRSRITVPTVQGWQRMPSGQWDHFIDVDNGIAYVRIVNFTKTSDIELAAILDELELDGMQGLVLDLRGNNGGYFETAVRIADMFIEEGLIVKKIPRRGEAEFEHARIEGTRPGYPIVILTDGRTASASEIVAGVLSDVKYERATIVGDRTYGKGSVITMTHSTGGGSQLWFTAAHYVLPSGAYVKDRYQSIAEGKSDWGIEPDVKVVLGNRELENIERVAHINEMVQKDDGEAILYRHSIDETLDADAQLEFGRLIMLTKLIRGGRM